MSIITGEILQSSSEQSGVHLPSPEQGLYVRPGWWSHRSAKHLNHPLPEVGGWGATGGGWAVIKTEAGLSLTALIHQRMSDNMQAEYLWGSCVITAGHFYLSRWLWLSSKSTWPTSPLQSPWWTFFKRQQELRAIWHDGQRILVDLTWMWETKLHGRRVVQARLNIWSSLLPDG